MLSTLDRRYLASIRAGTGLYVSGNGFASPLAMSGAGMGDARMMVVESMVMIAR